MNGLHIDTAIPILVVAAAALLACGAGVFYYRSTVPPVSRPRRILLTILRTLAIVLIVVLIAEPVVHMRFTTTSPPVLAVLVDNSKSMSISDGFGPRSETLRSVLANGTFDRIAAHATIQYYSFGARFQPHADLRRDSLSLDEGATDIAAALHALRQEQRQSPIDAALLISDGMYTLGSDPIHEAEIPGLPIVAVPIGDSTEQRDVAVAGIFSNELVYDGTPTPVNVRLRSAGFDGDRVEVTLAEGARVLAGRTITLQKASREYSIDMQYTPSGPGKHRYSVSVSRLAGEITYLNNSRPFSARVLKSKLHVVLLAGRPSPDIPAILQAFREDGNLSVRSFTQNATGGFYEGTPGRSILDSADCLVFAGFPSATVAPGTFRDVASVLAERQTPLLVIAGSSLDAAKLLSLGDVIPFTVASPAPTEQLISIQPVESQKANPILNVSETGGAWTVLPPLHRLFGLYAAKPGATVLGTVRLPNAVLRDPFLLTRTVGKQKSVALLAYDLWRWRLMTQDNPETATLLQAFLVNSVKWLTAPDDQRLIRVAPVQEDFTHGQEVAFAGQANLADGRLFDNASIRVIAEGNHERYELDLRPVGNGRYDGRFPSLPDGSYTFRAIGTASGNQLGDDTGSFTVGELDLELQETRANPALLQQLAYRSGGICLPPSDIGKADSLLALLPSYKQRTIPHAHDTELWHWPWLLGSIVVLFGTEWSIRKMSGML